MNNKDHQLIEPEDFGRLFQVGEFTQIFQRTSEQFQSLILLEQFIQSASSFNQNVKQYHLAFSADLPGIKHYVWLNDLKDKAISVSFDEHSIIQGLLLKPYITFPETDEVYTKTTYRMPVKDEWFVFWGGANELINYHYAYDNQRYAYDLLKVRDDSTYSNTPDENEDYFAFNQEIVAPADGTIVKVVDGLKDNFPGEMDAKNPAGNYVIIKHANKEYSMLAHLKNRSIPVKEGEFVKEGQCIGLCGNSGNSSEPHLHFQVMDRPDLSSGKSIRIRLTGDINPNQGDQVSGEHENI